ncbi:MAG: hypothetical protein V1777_05590 [Candidatus Micrarchaeota archaeon]
MNAKDAKSGSVLSRKKAILHRLKAKISEINKLENRLERFEPRPVQTEHLIEEIQVPSLEVLKDKKKEQ